MDKQFLLSFGALVLGVLIGGILEMSSLGEKKTLSSLFSLKNSKLLSLALATLFVGISVYFFNTYFDYFPQDITINKFTLGAVLVGGVLCGTGIALGGYLPETSLTSLGTGKISSIIFILGMATAICSFALLEKFIKKHILSRDLTLGSLDVPGAFWSLNNPVIYILAITLILVITLSCKKGDK
jgi:hypothetical protein